MTVEDDRFIADLLRDVLADDGHECDVALSAREGVTLARQCLHGLLLDVMLPEGRDAGFQLGQRVRAHGATAPILYLTARSAVEDRIYGLEAGGDDYLVIPFDFGELRARIRALLRRTAGYAPQLMALPQGLE
ncbi:response regulator [Deinococcus ruber]|uniref:response regulator n=1 Tax=Deinococcus ruber TaxID=1848197 RepID=UPI001E5F532A|nr:response regulator [Deinococcus ruber]